MSRKPPTLPPPEVKNLQDPGIVTQTRRYKLITPLYGGGVKPAEADPVTIVRPAEIRGHLRFWWRATRGWAYPTLGEMKQTEDEIWGSSTAPGKPGPSSISISIEVPKGVKPSVFQATNRQGNPIQNPGTPDSKDGYVAFPLRENHNPILLENVQFDLIIRYPKNQKINVEAALWGWETFGGLGARTRRGFGAVSCTHLDGQPVELPKRMSFEQSFKTHLALHSQSGSTKLAGVPYISQALRYVIKQTKGIEPISGWREMINYLRNFRQSRYPNMNNLPFGRSKWPEADDIRRITHSHSHNHAPRHPVNKFPRGKFGLPIIYQFIVGDIGDPEPTTLQGKEHDRLASPLILRPIACSDGAVGLAAILDWQPLSPDDEPYTPPGGLVLKGANGDTAVKSNLEPGEAEQIPPLKGEPDVLQAFLNFLKS